MKLLAKIVIPVLLLFATATAVALADVINPTTPYPAVPPNADVCQVEKLEVQRQQLEYDQAKTDYQRLVALRARGAASDTEVRGAERAMHLAGIRLNNAKYAEAACRNDKGNAANKVCVALSLELNRLLDELPMRRALEQIAIAEYNAAVRAGAAIAPAELERLRLAAQVATIERQQVEQKIVDQRRKIADNPACRDFPSERPAPVPTSTTVPAPTSTTPTSTTPTSNTTVPTGS